jgi:RNA polymerase sigma-70 factor (ECF subfamily)
VIRWKTALGGHDELEQAILVYLDALYRTALRMTHDREEAGRVVEETCLSACRSVSRARAGAAARAWLFTILRSLLRDRPGSEADDAEAAESVLFTSMIETGPAARMGASPEDEFFQTLLHGDVERALRELPPALREIVILADLEGLGYGEMAAVLGCSTGAVMSRLLRARTRLRALLHGFAREHGYLKDHE